MYWVVDTTLRQLQFQTMIFLSWKGISSYMGDCYTASYVLFPTFLPIRAISPLSDKIPEVMFTLTQKVWSLQTASKYSRLWNALTFLRLYLSTEVIAMTYHGNTYTYTQTSDAYKHSTVASGSWPCQRL